MFSHLARYSRVVVTGPQRSGTRICARMISADAGLRYVDENDLEIHNEQKFLGILNSQSGIVVQAPGMCHLIGDYGKIKGVAVVFMQRNLPDILKSQRRISWKGEAGEKAKFRLRNDRRPITKIKMDFWKRAQKRIASPYTVQYERLASHPLWMAAEQRKDFAPDQTKAAA